MELTLGRAKERVKFRIKDFRLCGCGFIAVPLESVPKRIRSCEMKTPPVFAAGGVGKRITEFFSLRSHFAG